MGVQASRGSAKNLGSRFADLHLQTCKYCFEVVSLHFRDWRLDQTHVGMLIVAIWTCRTSLHSRQIVVSALEFGVLGLLRVWDGLRFRVCGCSGFRG